MKTNNCKGCLIYENYMYSCIIKTSPNRLNCPCPNCIVKVMCKIGCQDYKDCEMESLNYEHK